MDLTRRHVIVTGGSSGIGRATARLLAQCGAHISIIARRQELLDETLAELEPLRVNQGQRFRAHSADVASWEQAEEAIAVLTAGGYSPDILINAAGIVHPGYVEQLPLESFRRTMDVDFFGTLHPIKAVLPAMMERRNGHIVNFASMAGFVGIFGYTAYSAAKFAVRGFSDALRDEMRPYGIHVSVVFPPDTDTPQLQYDKQFQPLEARRIVGANVQTQSADRVARIVVRGIERRQLYILPGLDAKFFFLIVNGVLGINGLARFLRWFLVDRVVDKVRRERGMQQ